MGRSRGGHESVIATALVQGHVQFRRGRMAAHRRYRIDRSDPAVWRVLVNVDLPAREDRATLDTIAEHLGRLLAEHRRARLAAVDPLEGPDDDEAATGTDGSDWSRPRFEIVE